MEKPITVKNLIARILNLEHRDHPRVRIYDDVRITFDPESHQGEEIIDLSISGIAFTYAAEGGKQLSDLFELDIQVEDVFHMGKIRVKKISDVVLGESVGTHRVTRRVGGRFLNLTPVQEYDLKKFLDQYGIP